MARDVQQENIYERKTKVCIISETDLEYRTGMQSFAVNWRKIRKALSIMSLLFRFHALRVAPKTIAHKVKAVCIKIIKHLTTLIKDKKLFCRSPKRAHGIKLHISRDYGCLSVVIYRCLLPSINF